MLNKRRALESIAYKTRVLLCLLRHWQRSWVGDPRPLPPLLPSPDPGDANYIVDNFTVAISDNLDVPGCSNQDVHTMEHLDLEGLVYNPHDVERPQETKSGMPIFYGTAYQFEEWKFKVETKLGALDHIVEDGARVEAQRKFASKVIEGLAG